jgi:hypothetical protein
MNSVNPLISGINIVAFVSAIVSDKIYH